MCGADGKDWRWEGVEVEMESAGKLLGSESREHKIYKERFEGKEWILASF
jgi:hypothetical protein